MLCLTGGERNQTSLAARLRANAGLPLQEARLDLLEDLDESVFALLRGPRLLVTCRAAAEGGGFKGSEADRLAVLRRALREQPAYLDLELSAGAAAWGELLAARGSTQLICSHHLLQAEADLPAIGRALADIPAQLHKLAVTVDDAAELLPLLELPFAGKLLRIGMGPAGLLSRVLPERFGSPWTYVFADGAPATASGQLSLAQAKQWRVDRPSLQPLVLIGGEQVLHSPGPMVYNQLFARRELPHLYLPVVSRRVDQLLPLLERLGVYGASVTMPLKESVLALLDERCSPADRIGAANTIRFSGGRRIGWNSDAPAIGLLCGTGHGREALVLGAGGAGRAAAWALLEAGWSVLIGDVDEPRAAALARLLGVPAVSWADCGHRRDPLLVNATPCGSDGKGDPIPERRDFAGATVLDLVHCGSSHTPLLRRAAADGARVITGLQMWLEQGARQMSWLLGTKLERADLAECLDD